MCSTQQHTVHYNVSAMLCMLGMMCMLCVLCVLCRGLEDAAHAPAEEGAEVEVFAAAVPAAAAAAGGSSGAVNGSSRVGGRFDARVSDQDVFTGDYEVAAAGGQPLMW